MLPVVQLADGVHCAIKIKDSLSGQRVQYVYKRPWSKDLIYIAAKDQYVQESIQVYQELVKTAYWSGEWDFFMLCDMKGNPIEKKEEK